MIGSFTEALFARVRQFDDGPQNLSASVDLDNRSEQRFHQIEGTQAAFYELKHRELLVHQLKWKAAKLGYKITPMPAAA